MDEVLCEQSWFYKIVIYTVKSTIKGTYFLKKLLSWDEIFLVILDRLCFNL